MNLSPEELSDIQTALLIAMKELDKVARPADLVLAGRLELISKKLYGNP